MIRRGAGLAPRRRQRRSAPRARIDATAGSHRSRSRRAGMTRWPAVAAGVATMTGGAWFEAAAARGASATAPSTAITSRPARCEAGALRACGLASAPGATGRVLVAAAAGILGRVTGAVGPVVTLGAWAGVGAGSLVGAVAADAVPAGDGVPVAGRTSGTDAGEAGTREGGDATSVTAGRDTRGDMTTTGAGAAWPVSTARACADAAGAASAGGAGAGVGAVDGGSGGATAAGSAGAGAAGAGAAGAGAGAGTGIGVAAAGTGAAAPGSTTGAAGTGSAVRTGSSEAGST